MRIATFGTILCGIIITGLLNGCSGKAPIQPTWTQETALTQAQCPPLTAIDLQALTAALPANIAQHKKNLSKQVRFGTMTFSQSVIAQSQEDLLRFIHTLSPATPDSTAAINRYIGTRFQCLSSSAESVLFTGYYIPTLQGSHIKTDRFRYPLYEKPDDLVTIALNKEWKEKLPKDFPSVSRGQLKDRTVTIPYPSREAIDFSGTPPSALKPLVWVDDAADLFFLHIQGSGIISFPDGSTMVAGYADKNGNPYRPIGKYFLEKGILSKGEITMYTIKDALRKHPELAQEAMTYNPSYVFFKTIDTYPVGSFGVPLTGSISIAIDTSLFPSGALSLTAVKLPTEASSQTRIAITQDTGGAIRGADRVDLFFGDTKEAEYKAAHMNDRGMLFFLVPRTFKPL